MVIQRYIETDGEWCDILWLAQKRGRAAQLGRFYFAFEGLRADLKKHDIGQAQESMAAWVRGERRQGQHVKTIWRQVCREGGA